MSSERSLGLQQRARFAVRKAPVANGGSTFSRSAPDQAETVVIVIELRKNTWGAALIPGMSWI